MFNKRVIFLCPIIFFGMILTMPVINAHNKQHKHVLDKDAIISKAEDIILIAIEKNKIQTSWKDATLNEVKTITVNSTDEWFVKFTNEKSQSPTKHIYLFFTLNGKFLAMNYTGK